jgi:hypothetical protein
VKKHKSCSEFCKGARPSISSFPRNNGDEAREWANTRTFCRLKYTNISLGKKQKSSRHFFRNMDSFCNSILPLLFLTINTFSFKIYQWVKKNLIQGAQWVLVKLIPIKPLNRCMEKAVPVIAFIRTFVLQYIYTLYTFL